MGLPGEAISLSSWCFDYDTNTYTIEKNYIDADPSYTLNVDTYRVSFDSEKRFAKIEVEQVENGDKLTMLFTYSYEENTPDIPVLD